METSNWTLQRGGGGGGVVVAWSTHFGGHQSVCVELGTIETYPKTSWNQDRPKFMENFNGSWKIPGKSWNL